MFLIRKKFLTGGTDIKRASRGSFINYIDFKPFGVIYVFIHFGYSTSQLLTKIFFCARGNKSITTDWLLNIEK